MTESNVRIVSSSNSWIEGPAIDQLKNASKRPGVLRAIGMPDLHPGRGIPVGAVVITQDLLYPFLIGNDIGCGIGLWQSDVKVRKAKLDRWIKRLSTLPDTAPEERIHVLANHEFAADAWDPAMGTVGAGNHFAELTRVHEVHDQGLFEACSLDKQFLFVMVHSGSRGLGESILRKHVDVCKDGPLTGGSAEADAYLERHDYAVRWARLNRDLIRTRFLKALGASGALVSDTTHNSLTPLSDGRWLHRKGAAPSDGGLVVVAGSRGSLSYLVRPVGNREAYGWSIAHGAGRKWNRSQAKARLSPKVSVGQLRQTGCGNRVICDDKALLYEEAPQMYKNIDQVISDLKDAGLIEVIASFQPMITYKNG